MEDDRDNGESPGDAPEDEAREGELASLFASGPNGGNRAGGLALLAIVVVVAGALHFHFAETGSGAFLSRLDSALLTHAELTLASREEDGRLAVVPSWPLRLYATLRRDIIVYAALAVLAAWLWALSARSRARRDAYLIHQKLTTELDDLRRRLDRLDRPDARTTTDNRPGAGDTKG